jgi:hypothetical protein
MKKILGWTAVGIMSVGALGACSSDKKSPSTTKAPAVTTGDTTSGADTGSAAADKFCTDVADLINKGPTDPNYTANLQKLITESQTLLTSEPGAAAKIQDCLTKLNPGG